MIYRPDAVLNLAGEDVAILYNRAERRRGFQFPERLTLAPRTREWWFTPDIINGQVQTPQGWHIRDGHFSNQLPPDSEAAVWFAEHRAALDDWLAEHLPALRADDVRQRAEWNLQACEAHVTEHEDKADYWRKRLVSAEERLRALSEGGA